MFRAGRMPMTKGDLHSRVTGVYESRNPLQRLIDAILTQSTGAKPIHFESSVEVRSGRSRRLTITAVAGRASHLQWVIRTSEGHSGGL